MTTTTDTIWSLLTSTDARATTVLADLVEEVGMISVMPINKLRSVQLTVARHDTTRASLSNLWIVSWIGDDQTPPETRYSMSFQTTSSHFVTTRSSINRVTCGTFTRAGR